MTEQALPTTKAELIERIARSRSALEHAVGRVPTNQLDVAGADGWSAKDHLAHLAAWERSTVSLLQGLPRHTALGVSEDEYHAHDTDHLNNRIRESRRHWALAQVVTEFQTVHDDLLDALNRLTDEDLGQPYSHFQPNEPGDDSGAPVVNWIAGNTYEHFDAHLRWIEAVIGRP